MSILRLTRRGALQGIGSLSFAAAMPISKAWADQDGPSLNFLAIGDWGREGLFHQREVASQMGESAQKIGAKFILSVGDNFYEDGVTGIDDPAWKKSFEEIYDAQSLQVPWYVALGNHDYHGNPQAQLEYATKSARWNLPARWYQFVHQAPDRSTVAFFVTDTSPMISAYYTDGAIKVKVGDQKSNIPHQLRWLDNALSASKADWKIVIGHHPIYSGKVEKSVSRSDPDRVERMTGGSPDLIAQLDPILQRHRVPLYLNGHDHDLQHVKHALTHYVCTGAGSKMAPQCDMLGSDFCSLRSGFIACAVNHERIRVAYRDYTGAELFVVDIPRPV